MVMSITFTAAGEDGRVVGGFTTKEEPCLCAQDAPTWGLGRELVRDDLKNHANPQCHMCHGTGVEEVQYDNLPYLNMANDNGLTFLKLLGWTEDYCGSKTVPESRRALMAAKARFSRLAPSLVRGDETHYGAPRTLEDGTVELRPVRVYSMGLTEERLQDYLVRFEELLEAGILAGGVKITWG